MSELSNNLSQSAAHSGAVVLAPNAHVAVGIKQSITVVRALPSLLVREISRLFLDTLFGRPNVSRSATGQSSDKNGSASINLLGQGSLLSAPPEGADFAAALSFSKQPVTLDQMSEAMPKEVEREIERNDRHAEPAVSQKGKGSKEPTRDGGSPASKTPTEPAWGMKQALEKINEAIKRITESEPSSEFDPMEFEVREDHHFTVVEVDDQENGYRKFTMFAEDDEFMLEPWQFRFNETIMQIEIFVSDPKQLPIMMERTTELETSLSQSTGLQVVLSFYCPGKRK
jgi:hypothetical protein